MSRTLDQILAIQKPEIVADAQAKAAEILINIHLAFLLPQAQK
ncbi:hypothetical protein [Edaphovirga cremea]|nr:hypothetical protein [Edaphovirga cremea]